MAIVRPRKTKHDSNSADTNNSGIAKVSVKDFLLAGRFLKYSEGGDDGYSRTVCPYCKSTRENLSFKASGLNRTVFRCWAGCSAADVAAAMGVQLVGPNGGGRDVFARPKGLTLQEYAGAKKLDAEFLRREFRLSESTYYRSPVIVMPYLSEKGAVVSNKLRLAMEGDRKTIWEKGSKPVLYGLHLLDRTRKAGYAVLCEGESDAHTLAQHGIPALGLPGAGGWDEARDAKLVDGIPKIFVVIEPDRGGDAVMRWVSASSIRDRVYLVSLAPFKDPSELHIANPKGFDAAFRRALERATPLSEILDAERKARRAELWKICKKLAGQRNILDHLKAALRELGVVGEVNTAKIIYLTFMSRVLNEPQSLMIKGVSSAGKSFVLEKGD